MSVFKKAKKPALWTLKIGGIAVITKIILAFMAMDGNAAGEALVTGPLGVIIISLLTYILALPFYLIRKK